MFFRYSLRTTRFVDVWLDTINADPEYWDQNAFNDLARAGWDPVNKVRGGGGFIQDQRWTHI